MEQQIKQDAVQTVVVCRSVTDKEYSCEVDFDFWGKPFIYRAWDVETGSEVNAVSFLTMLEYNNREYLNTLRSN